MNSYNSCREEHRLGTTHAGVPTHPRGNILLVRRIFLELRDCEAHIQPTSVQHCPCEGNCDGGNNNGARAHGSWNKVLVTKFNLSPRSCSMRKLYQMWRQKTMGPICPRFKDVCHMVLNPGSPRVRTGRKSDNPGKNFARLSIQASSPGASVLSNLFMDKCRALRWKSSTTTVSFYPFIKHSNAKIGRIRGRVMSMLWFREGKVSQWSVKVAKLPDFGWLNLLLSDLSCEF